LSSYISGKRGAPQAFPRKVFEILKEQSTDIVGWSKSGLTFHISDMDRFVNEGATRLENARASRASFSLLSL
jgi:hypothetical protein